MHDYVIFIKPQFVLRRLATAHGLCQDVNAGCEEGPWWFELYDDAGETVARVRETEIVSWSREEPKEEPEHEHPHEHAH